MRKDISKYYNPNKTISENAVLINVCEKTIKNYMRKNNISARNDNQNNKIKKLRKMLSLLKKSGRKPTIKTLSENLNWSNKTVVKYLKYCKNNVEKGNIKLPKSTSKESDERYTPAYAVKDINPTLTVMFSSKEEVWSTPLEFYNSLNAEFNFDLDPCALAENAKCDKYFTPDIDGLKQDWKGYTVFCNPPYGQKIADWVRKCFEESQKENTTVVMLIPARTDTIYFHEYIYMKAKEIRFIKGRLKFGNSKNSAPFPSMVVIF